MLGLRKQSTTKTALPNLKLGVEARDVVTGFSGIVTYKVEYLTGCDQWGLQPLIGKDGDLKEIKQFDENRIEVTGAGITLPKEEPTVRTGGPSLSINSNKDIKA
jgi:hypothetical protein